MMTGRFIQRLRSDQQGAAIIELAMAAPILALLVMAAADVGSVFSRKLALEQGAQRAVEKVMQTTELDRVQDNISDEVAIQANVDPSQAVVTFPRYCNDRLMTDTARDADGFAMGTNCDAGEVPRHYILVTVTEEYDPIFPFLSMGTKLANGKYKIEAKAGMRTK